MRHRRTLTACVAAGMAMGLSASVFADQGQTKTASQVQELASKATTSLPQLIQTAEQRTGGKAICATLVEWQKVKDRVLSASQATGSGIGTGANTGADARQDNTTGQNQPGNTTGQQNNTTGTRQPGDTGMGTADRTNQPGDATRAGDTIRRIGDRLTGDQQQDIQLETAVTKDQLQNKNDVDPVALVVTSTPGSITEVLVCGLTNKVIATSKDQEYTQGKSAFLERDSSDRFASNDSRYRDDRYNDRDRRYSDRDRRFNDSDQRFRDRDRRFSDADQRFRDRDDRFRDRDDRMGDRDSHRIAGRDNLRDRDRYDDRFDRDRDSHGGMPVIGGDRQRDTRDERRFDDRGNARDRLARDDWNRPASRWQKLSDLMKKPVHNSHDQREIGDVEDFVIDPDAGRVMFTVIDFDDNLNHSAELYAVPFRLAKLSPDYRSIDLDYQRSELENAGGFSNNNWPNMAEESWARQTYQAFGLRPYWERQSQRDRAGDTLAGRNEERDSVVRRTSIEDRDRTGTTGVQAPRRWQKGSDLIGKEVRNAQNEDLGNLHEIVIDADNGRILYGVLSFGGFLGMGDKLFAIPWSSMRLASDYKSVVLNVDKETLKNAEGFDKDNWPDMADPRWATKTHDYYGQRRYWESDR